MQIDPILLDRAKAMRKTMTPAERALWNALKSRQLRGVKFSRQAVVDRYIVDFVARSHRLVIEIDGDTHACPKRDRARTARLEQLGYQVVRFTNGEVMTNLDGLLEAVSSALGAAPLPTLSPKGRGL